MACLLCGDTPADLPDAGHSDLVRLQEHLMESHAFTREDLQRSVRRTAYMWTLPDEEGYYMQAIELEEEPERGSHATAH